MKPSPRLPASITQDPALARVIAALAPHQALIVGGAVRNALLGEPVNDIDIATDAHPETTIAAAKAAGLAAIPTGIEHGTITVVSNGHPFEVTTFRRDVATDGRRAIIAFSDRIEDDAARRDFTMNALYATADGTVLDPMGGLADLAARRLRFVGDANTRIAEDHLRILRFYRFHAWYGRPGHADPAALAACAAGVAGLAKLSRERIGAETIKLLSAPDPTDALRLMDKAGALAAILPGADLPRLLRMITTESGADWALRLAALSVADAPNRLRLSRAQTIVQTILQDQAALPLAEAAFRLGEERAVQLAQLRRADGRPLPDDWRAIITHAAAQIFPLSATDLLPDITGPALGQALKQAETDWIASGFILGRDALIAAAKDRA